MSPLEFIHGTVLFILLAIFVYYMLVRKPEMAREQAQEKFLKELKKDDRVMTVGGIFGKVSNKSDKAVMVEIANNVKVKVHADYLVAVKKEENSK